MPLRLGLLWANTGDPVMKRFAVSKKHSAKQFRGKVGRTKAANLQPQPMRGGWRM